MLNRYSDRKSDSSKSIATALEFFTTTKTQSPLWIKFLLVLAILWAGFVCGGAFATYLYSDKLVHFEKQIDKSSALNQKLSDQLLLCKVMADINTQLRN